MRYRDDLPKPKPSLPPIMPTAIPPSSPPAASTSTSIVRTCMRQVLNSSRNKFGLIRQYFTDKLPLHNPEDAMTSEDRTSIPPRSNSHNAQPASNSHANEFYPYPNKNLFHLGNWQWNGVRKSQQSFKELLAIIGDPEFSQAMFGLPTGKLLMPNWVARFKRMTATKNGQMKM